MTSFRDHLYAVDWDRAVRLGKGQIAAMTVTPEGQQWPWLLRDSDDEHMGCACAKCAPHDQLGRLPDIVLKRLHGTCWRKGCDRTAECRGAWCHGHNVTACAGNTKQGRPCRNTVRAYERWCPAHDHAAAPRRGRR